MQTLSENNSSIDRNIFIMPIYYMGPKHVIKIRNSIERRKSNQKINGIDISQTQHKKVQLTTQDKNKTDPYKYNTQSKRRDRNLIRGIIGI
jgi:hypothetical protein